MNRCLDAYSKAHLTDAKSHIERVLDSEFVYNPGGAAAPEIDLSAFFGRDAE